MWSAAPPRLQGGNAASNAAYGNVSLTADAAQAAKCGEVRPRLTRLARPTLGRRLRAHFKVARIFSITGRSRMTAMPSRGELYALARQRRPGDVAAQLLQPLAVACFDPYRGAQAETVDLGAHGLTRCCMARHSAAERQHLLPSAGAEGAMLQVMAAACSGRNVRASLPSPLGSAR